ncbi:MAG: helix-turn-helix domain-containing protein [Actinomycetaceae bacterium]|nr:helix-turn-helix domain-containing protein [Actinomycetaceae bacterium]
MTQHMSWPVWAQGLRGLTPSQSLVLFELARLADSHGVVICAVEHLTTITGISRRAVFYALSGLEARGALSRQMRYKDGKKASSRFVLHATAGASERAKSNDDVALAGAKGDASVEVPCVLDPSDNEGLRALLVQGSTQGWQGAAGERLAVALKEVGARQFAVAIAGAMQFGGMTRQEAEADTIGIAWEAATTLADKLVQAQRPWAMLTTIVNRRRAGREELVSVERAVEPAEMPEEGLRPGMGFEGDVWVSVDDFEGTFVRLVDALISAGMSETLAWAGTLRVAELAVGDASRRHSAAGADPRLSDLGVPPHAARAWMTMLVGSRRGTKGGILTLDDEALTLEARKLVESFDTATSLV